MHNQFFILASDLLQQHFDNCRLEQIINLDITAQFCLVDCIRHYFTAKPFELISFPAQA